MPRTKSKDKRLFIADFIDPADMQKKWVTFVDYEGCERIRAATKAIQQIYGEKIKPEDVLIVSMIGKEYDYGEGHEYSIIPFK